MCVIVTKTTLWLLGELKQNKELNTQDKAKLNKAKKKKNLSQPTSVFNVWYVLELCVSHNSTS